MDFSAAPLNPSALSALSWQSLRKHVVLPLRGCSERSARAILGSVARRIFQVAAGFVLVMVTLTPLAECFDHWDKNVVPSNDTELNITASLIAVGLIGVVAKLLRYNPALPASKLQRVRCLHNASLLPTGANDRPASTASPPLVALRI